MSPISDQSAQEPAFAPKPSSEARQVRQHGNSDVRNRYQLVAMKPGRLPEVWEMVHPLLLRVVEGSGGEWTFESLMQEIATHEIALWAVVGLDGMEALVGTQLGIASSGMRKCTIRFVVGENANSWTHLVSELEDFARLNGCSRIETWARKGWARKLPDYRMTHVLLERDL